MPLCLSLQNGRSVYHNFVGFTANATTSATAMIETDEWVSTTTSVSNSQFTFTGLDDTQGYAYEPYIDITSSSTNKKPYATINTITGSGTSSMSVTWDTDADSGATVKLRLIK